MKHVKLFESFFPRGKGKYPSPVRRSATALSPQFNRYSGNKFIWLGYSHLTNGYSVGVVTKEEGEILEELVGGEVLPMGDNIYGYIDLEKAEMSAEAPNFEIEGLSFVSADGEDNYDDEPDENKLVIELPKKGILRTAPDQNGWNAHLLSVSEFIEDEVGGDDED